MIRLVLLRLLETYFRHRFLYLVPMVLMGALAGVFIARSPTVYTTWGVMYVENNTLLTSLTAIGTNGFSWSSEAQLTVNEINELLQTEAFVRSAIQETNLEAEMAKGPDVIRETIWQFRKAVWVTPVGSNLVEFGARHEKPELAQQIATSTMNTYIQWKLSSDRRQSESAQSFFANQLVTYGEDLQQAREEMRTYLEVHPEPVRGERSQAEQMEISRLQFAIEQAAKRVEDTQSKEEEARLALSKSEADVNQAYIQIDAPQLPTEPNTSLRDLLKESLIFVILGLLLSFGGIVGGMLLDRSLRFPIDVRHGLSLPVLAMVSGDSRSAPVHPAGAQERMKAPRTSADVSLSPKRRAEVAQSVPQEVDVHV